MSTATSTANPTWQMTTSGTGLLSFWNSPGTYSLTLGSTGLIGVGTSSAADRLTIAASGANVMSLGVFGTGEAYSFVSSSKNQYTPTGTISYLANTPGTANSATLIDISAYQGSGNTNVYLGAAAGPTANAAAHFVIGRRTGTTSWTESLRITDSGRLGVGTNTPLNFISFSHASDPSIWLGGTNGTKGVQFSQAGGTAWYSTSAVLGDLVIRNEDSTKKVFVQAGAGASVLTVTNANVGVNTASPAASFHHAGNFTYLDGTGGTGDHRLILSKGSAEPTVGTMIFAAGGNTAGNGWAEIGLRNNKNLSFVVNSSAGAYPTNAQMVLKANGNLGIGHSDPPTQLCMQASNLNLTNTQNVSTTMTLLGEYGAEGVRGGSVGGYLEGGTNYMIDTYVLMGVYWNGSKFSGFVRCSDLNSGTVELGGKVGVGVAQPTEKLHVVGNVLATGVVKSNAPVFSASMNYTLAISSGVVTAVPYNIVDFDSHNAYSGSTYRYTAPVAGYYLFTWEVIVGGVTANSLMEFFSYIRKNGTTHQWGTDIVPSSNHYNATNGSCVVQLAVNDYVEIWMYHNTGANVDCCPAPSIFPMRFTGALVRAS